MYSFARKVFQNFSNCIIDVFVNLLRCKLIYTMDTGKTLVQLRLSIMQIWESPKSQYQILGNLMLVFYLFILLCFILTVITTSLRCLMFVGTSVAVSMIVHLQSTPNLGICLHLRCLMLISPIVLLVKDV